ncbi:MAG TPA: hypothetical protein EYQ69_06700 [Gemmatimonadetes bacterium]|nr:hypothetical protein [Gemmatimonadota bacterium]
MSILHVFIYVCPAQEDIFAGVRNGIEGDSLNQHISKNLHLEDKEYDYITRVEFSIRRYARFLFYGPIFKKIEGLIIEILQTHGMDQPVVFYLADEGVWAELIRDIIKRHAHTRTSLLVNVQHGLMGLGIPSLLWLRKSLNSIARLFSGYPIFGYGFGGGACDIHLVYGEKEVEFLKTRQIKLALSAPTLIKHDLRQQYQKTVNNQAVDPGLVLVVLPACVPGSDMRCNLPELLNTISPVVQWVEENTEYQILVRPHPGRRDRDTINLINQSALGPFVEIDLEKQLILGLSRAAFVMGVQSTVLFDSLYLGKVPLAIRSHCHDEALPFPHEVIDVRSAFADKLVHVLSSKTREHYTSILNKPELDWKHEIERFITQCPDTN